MPCSSVVSTMESLDTMRTQWRCPLSNKDDTALPCTCWDGSDVNALHCVLGISESVRVTHAFDHRFAELEGSKDERGLEGGTNQRTKGASRRGSVPPADAPLEPDLS